MGLIIHVDGGARGNPGPAGAGVVITTDQGQRVHEAGYFLGTQTNNAAEYHALIRALERVQDCADQPVSIRSDSELLVRQITGQYRVKSQRLAGLFEQVQLLLLRIGVWSVQHVPREQNARADELANLAMDRECDVIVFDAHVKTPDSAFDAAGAAVGHDADGTSESGESATGGMCDEAGGRRSICVRVVERPGEEECPAGGLAFEECRVGARLPGGMCLYAAQALLPTLLAMLSTTATDFDRMPVMTVRCARRACRATFHVMARRGANGSPKG